MTKHRPQFSLRALPVATTSTATSKARRVN
jgi:hypothetical protein